MQVFGYLGGEKVTSVLSGDKGKTNIHVQPPLSPIMTSLWPSVVGPNRLTMLTLESHPRSRGE